MESQVSTLKCPSCGASLDLDGSSLILRCKFCGNVIQVSGITPAPARPAALPPGIEEIRQLAQAGKMIEAIKRYRAIYNVGLAEAKGAVEALQANRWVAPE
jgi:tRNA(Ile2) C34 agmatinyltransferase TiaS